MQQFTPIPEFDELTKMAQNNPDQLEALRLKLIDETISLADQSFQRKLRGLQFHIDMEIRRAKSPMAACVKISEMMHGSLNELRNAITNRPQQENSAVFTSRVRDSYSEDYSKISSGPSTHNPKSAKLLMFPVV